MSSEEALKPKGRFLDRVEFSKEIGISIATIRNWEKMRKFSGPSYIESGSGRFGGRRMYGLEKVEEAKQLLLRRAQAAEQPKIPVETLTREGRIMRIYEAEDAKKAFEMLDRKVPPTKLVTELGIHPHAVKAILADYAELAGGMFVEESVLKKIEALPIDGCFPLEGSRALLELLTDLSSDRCSSCRSRVKTICKPCGGKKTEA